jgi:signal transduction histidine kinase
MMLLLPEPYSVHYILLGILLMTLAHFFFSYLLYRQPLYLLAWSYVICLVGAYYVTCLAKYQDVFIVMGYFFYGNAILIYTKQQLKYAIKTQIIVGSAYFIFFGILRWVGLESFFFSMIGVCFIGYVVIYKDLIFTDRPLLLSCLACIITLWIILIFKVLKVRIEHIEIVEVCMGIFQILTFLLSFMKHLHLSNTEKTELQLLFAQQAKEKAIIGIKTYETKNTINSFLHDDVGAQMSVIVSLAQLSGQNLVSNPQKSQAYLNDIVDNLNNIIPKIEQIEYIGENTNEDLPKSYTLFKETTSILLDATKVQYSLYTPDSDDIWSWVSPKILNQLLLVYREILVNIVKHSQASQVSVNILIQQQNIKLLISDNGIGFDMSENSDGYGLFSIKKRIQDLGGIINIFTSKNKGCKYHIEVSL